MLGDSLFRKILRQYSISVELCACVKNLYAGNRGLHIRFCCTRAHHSPECSRKWRPILCMSAAANLVPRKRLRPLVLHHQIEQVLLVSSPCRLAQCGHHDQYWLCPNKFSSSTSSLNGNTRVGIVLGRMTLTSSVIHLELFHAVCAQLCSQIHLPTLRSAVLPARPPQQKSLFADL